MQGGRDVATYLAHPEVCRRFVDKIFRLMVTTKTYQPDVLLVY